MSKQKTLLSLKKLDYYHAKNIHYVFIINLKYWEKIWPNKIL